MLSPIVMDGSAYNGSRDGALDEACCRTFVANVFNFLRSSGAFLQLEVAIGQVELGE
jgi:hypothetical protein